MLLKQKKSDRQVTLELCFPLWTIQEVLQWKGPSRLSQNEENCLPDFSWHWRLSWSHYFCPQMYTKTVLLKVLFCGVFFVSFFLQNYCAIQFPKHEWDNKNFFQGWTLLSSVSRKQTIPDSSKLVISTLGGDHLPSPAVLWSSTSSQAHFNVV